MMDHTWRIRLSRVISSAIVIVTLLLTEHSVANPLFELKKVGEAKLKVLFWDIYDSSLYTLNGLYQPTVFPQALDIVYLRDIAANELIENTKEEWQKLGIKNQDSARWLLTLKEILPDIKKGDRVTLLVNRSKQSEFFFNSDSIGSISDPDFGREFLRIWLDINTSYPKVRNKLIGKSQ